MKLSQLTIYAGFLLFAIACNKKIDAIRPLDKIDKEGELSSVVGIAEATTGNYLLMRSYGFSNYGEPLMNISEGRGNNITLQQWGLPNQQTDAFFFRNTNVPNEGFSDAIYRGAYQIIVGANTVIEGITSFEKNPRYAGLSNNDKNRVLYAMGENKFLRAFTYFNLIRIYGKPYYQNDGNNTGVPLKLTSDINDMPASSSVKEVYEFIVKELKEAAQLMKSPAPAGIDNSFTNTGAAWTLLSRAYLYMGGSITHPNESMNKEAVLYADSVIDESNGKYTLLQGTAYANMFGDDEFGTISRATFSSNKEIIFALNNSQGGIGVGELFHYDLNYDVGAIFLPSSSLRALFQPNDVRGTFFKLNPNSGFVETTKWLCLNEAWLTYAPIIYFRLAEAYLNRAEANAKLGNITLAKNDLKAIHTRAGLSAASVDAIPNQDLIMKILEERRMEFAFEGHNSYDNFRNGLSMTRIAADNNGTASTIQPDDPKVVFTLPTF